MIQKVGDWTLTQKNQNFGRLQNVQKIIFVKLIRILQVTVRFITR